MSNLEMKLGSMLVIFLVGLAGGLVTLRLEKFRGVETLFSLGSALAGGVFLGAGLIHLLPDSIAAFEEALPHHDYPLAALLAASGCVFILFLERVLLASMDAEGALAGADQKGSVSVLALTAALSIHSLLAGAALGSDDTVAGSLVIFLAIIAHKGSAAFALSVSLVRNGLNRKTVMKIISLFSLMTPFGILLGLAFETYLTGSGERLFEGVFDGLAAGTFVYIASIDIIVEEFASPKNRWPKFWLLASGLGLMAAIAAWV
jgi:zinc transporter 1/2/3